MMDEWIRLKGSNIYYRETEDRLEMKSLSPAFVTVIVLQVICTLIGLGLASASFTGQISWATTITFLILFVIIPFFFFPVLTCRNHLIIDNMGENLDILKKNVHERIISRKSFLLKDISDIIIRVIAGKGTSYALSFMTTQKNEVWIMSNFQLGVVREVERLLRLHAKELGNRITQLSCPDVTLPIYPVEDDASSHLAPLSVVNPASHLTCAIDHAVIEGIVYICPACYAMLCNSCLSEYLLRSLGCPRCGRPVQANQASDEHHLLEIIDENEHLEK